MVERCDSILNQILEKVSIKQVISFDPPSFLRGGRGVYIVFPNLDGVSVSVVVTEAYRGTFPCRTSTGKVRVNIDRFPERPQMFPEPKNGFDFEKLADALLVVANTKRREKEHQSRMEERRKQCKEGVARLNGRFVFNLERSPLSVKSKDGIPVINLSLDLDVDVADKILTILSREALI